jgi:hypothetical protein
MKKIPAAVANVVSGVLSGSHATLNDLFRRAGAPGEPPQLSHATKWKTWLLRANESQDVDPIAVLGKVLEEFMEVEPPHIETVGELMGLGSPRDQWRSDKERVETALRKHGLRYARGGRVVPFGRGGLNEALTAALRQEDLKEVEIELERALNELAEDPGSAITSGCALLEALFKAYIEKRELRLPNKETLKPLWSAVQKDIGFDPGSQTDDDIQRILSGLTSIVDGIAALRTHGGSAHGGGKQRYRMGDRHARLAVGSAQVLALFVIETWRVRVARKAGQPPVAADPQKPRAAEP